MDEFYLLPTDKIIQKTISIDALVSKVWNALTNPENFSQWMSDGAIEVISDWKPGSPILFTGTWNGHLFNDKGVFLESAFEKVFRYSYWSRISQLPDVPENYFVIEFRLVENKGETILNLTQTNLLTETIYHHWNFYWNVTLHILKKRIEGYEE